MHEQVPGRVILSWSSGKDSAWALQALKQQPGTEVCALITAFNRAMDRVAMHAVRRELAHSQARAAGLPLIEVDLPWPCTNEAYEQIFGDAITDAAKRFATKNIAFGDLFLEDIRDYRYAQMNLLGLHPQFPLWAQPTAQLAMEMITAGLRAEITCIDPKQLDPAFVGRSYDAQLIDDLPANVDPCGENGEFHTFAWDGPMFSEPIRVRPGEIVARDGFWFADLIPARDSRPRQGKV